MINRKCPRIMLMLLVCFYPLVLAAQSQSIAPVITFLLSNEKPSISIPNQGSQIAGTDLVVLENASQQATFDIDFNTLAAASSALTISNDQSSASVEISATELENLANNNIVVPGFSGSELRLIGSTKNQTVTTVTYQYNLVGLAIDHSAGPNSVIDQFELVARNSDSESSIPISLEILIADAGLSPAPVGSVGLITSIIDAGTGTSLANVLALGGTGKDATSFSGVASAAMNLFSDGARLSIASIVASGDLTNLDAIGENLNPPTNFNCVNCFSQAIPADPTLISDQVKHIATNYTVEWGRRSDITIVFDLGSSSEQYNGADIFYAYSNDATSDTSAQTIGITTLSYSKILGSNPIDQDGVSGTLGAINLDINFASQQITSFDLNLTTADGDWNVHIPFVTGTTIQDPVALSENQISFSLEGLGSDPTGGLTAAGTSTRYDVFGDVQIALLGPNADAVMLTYNLSVIDTLGAPQDAEAVGVALLKLEP